MTTDDITAREIELTQRLASLQREVAADMGGKVCSKCKDAKPLSAFGKNRRNKDGLEFHCNPCRRAAAIAHSNAVRARLIDLLGGCCVSCGSTGALDLDHIEGSGKVDREIMGGNRGMERYYLRNPDLAKERLQLMCRPCHIIKCSIERRATGLSGGHREMSESAIQNERRIIEARRAALITKNTARSRPPGQEVL